MVLLRRWNLGPSAVRILRGGHLRDPTRYRRAPARAVPGVQDVRVRVRVDAPRGPRGAHFQPRRRRSLRVDRIRLPVLQAFPRARRPHLRVTRVHPSGWRVRRCAERHRVRGRERPGVPLRERRAGERGVGVIRCRPVRRAGEGARARRRLRAGCVRRQRDARVPRAGVGVGERCLRDGATRGRADDARVRERRRRGTQVGAADGDCPRRIRRR